MLQLLQPILNNAHKEIRYIHIIYIYIYINMLLGRNGRNGVDTQEVRL